MIKTVLFDMDGTLLPMDTKSFEKLYFKTLAARVAPLGYEPSALIQGVLAGVQAMIRNDGSVTNDVAFWKVFAGMFGNKAYNDVAAFDEYYRTDFVAAKAACGFNVKAVEIVKRLNKCGLQVVLATNPLFPLVAQQARVGWAGLDVNEDMIAQQLGMKVFLVTDCLINADGKDISVYPNGNFDDLVKFLETNKIA